MSSQSIRNILNAQIENVLQQAQIEVKKQGRQKLEELKKKIPTPQTLKEKLKAEINSDTCSEKGKEKFMAIYNKLNNNLVNVESKLDLVLNKLTDLDSAVGKILGEQGPMGVIKSFGEILKGLLTPLNVIILGAPLLLAANSGPTSSGAVTDQVVEGKNKAKSTLKEYQSLIASIPIIILLYINKAKRVAKNLEEAISKLTFIKDEVVKCRAYLDSLLLDFEAQCASSSSNNPNTSVDNGVINPPNPNVALENYIAQLQNQYNDVYNLLVEEGQDKAIERIFTITENLEKGYYIQHKVINLSTSPNEG